MLLVQGMYSALTSSNADSSSSTILFKQLMVSANTVHILAVTSSFASNTLTTMSLNLTTSIPLADLIQIPSMVDLPSDALLAAASSPGVARVVWFEHGRIRSAYLSAAGQLGDTKDLLPGKGRKYSRLLDVGVRSKGFVLGQMEDGKVDIVDVRGGAKVVDSFGSSVYLLQNSAWSLADSWQEDSPDRSTSVYSAAETKDGLIFNRLYWSFGMNVSCEINFLKFMIPSARGCADLQRVLVRRCHLERVRLPLRYRLSWSAHRGKTIHLLSDVSPDHFIGCRIRFGQLRATPYTHAHHIKRGSTAGQAGRKQVDSRREFI